VARANSPAKNLDTISVRVPIAFRRRGGRKIVMMPEGSKGVPPLGQRANAAAIRALARAFRWRKLIETGVHQTIQEIADAEKANPSYVGRVLRLTLLSPDIVEAILDGRQPACISLCGLMRPFSAAWECQMANFPAAHQ
jgi:hypothetical protein